MIKKILLTVFITMNSVSAFAVDFNIKTGDDLLSNCKKMLKVIEDKSVLKNAEANNDVRTALNYLTSTASCGNYINGLLEGIYLSEVTKKVRLLCIPEQVNKGEIFRVIVRYLENRPQVLRKISSGLVYQAITEAWPCQSKK